LSSHRRSFILWVCYSLLMVGWSSLFPSGKITDVLNDHGTFQTQDLQQLVPKASIPPVKPILHCAHAVCYPLSDTCWAYFAATWKGTQSRQTITAHRLIIAIKDSEVILAILCAQSFLGFERLQMKLARFHSSAYNHSAYKHDGFTYISHIHCPIAGPQQIQSSLDPVVTSLGGEPAEELTNRNRVTQRSHSLSETLAPMIAYGCGYWCRGGLNDLIPCTDILFLTSTKHKKNTAPKHPGRDSANLESRNLKTVWLLTHIDP
jgi:hypothetical protein